MYSIDFDILRKENLPETWKKPVAEAMIKVLSAHLELVYAEFMVFKAQTDLRLAHNGTVESLESLLNYLFPTDTEVEGVNPITIVDAILPEETYIGCAGSDEETYICSNNHNLNEDTYIGNAPQYLTGVDFVVNVPSALHNSEVMINKIVNEYRVAGKLFAINYI